MKIVIASILIFAAIIVISFQNPSASSANNSWHLRNTVPTPTIDQPKPSSTPDYGCKPAPTPLSEEEINNPLREMTLEDALNLGLGNRDIDCDGICNIADNCILTYNPDQKDKNGDGIGDVCEPDPNSKEVIFLKCDMDGDGISDNKDNCPGACNEDQKDENRNRIGDVCDSAFPNAFLGIKKCKKRKQIKTPKFFLKKMKKAKY